MKGCAAAASVALAGVMSGCASLTASRAHPATRPPSALAQAQRTHEYPSPHPREAVFPGFADPVLAVRAFAIGYINWTAATVTGRMRGLATLSIGQARAAMAQAAAQTASDYELRRGGVANVGAVEAVAPLGGGGGRYAVVTLERTTATRSAAYQGLAPSWHVAVATVARASGGWVVSGWQPEN